MSGTFDFSEVASLRANLGAAPSRVAPLARKALEVTARNVKDDARALARGQAGRHAAGYPAAMEYEIKATDHQVRAEIGPRPGGQGDLAPIFETGNPFSGRKPSLEPALDYNTDDFLTGMKKALEDGLGDLT